MKKIVFSIDGYSARPHCSWLFFQHELQSSQVPTGNWPAWDKHPLSLVPCQTYPSARISPFPGSDGCNRISGTYAVSGSSLTFKLGPSTLMACPEDVMKQADDFTKGLSETASYRDG